MEHLIAATFGTRDEAAEAIERVREARIPIDAISYIYQDIDRDDDESPLDLKDEDDTETETDVDDDITEEVEADSELAGALGMIAGLTAVRGVLPALGPVIAAGPMALALGVSKEGVAAGAPLGGITEALINWGIPRDTAEQYEDRVKTEDILVLIHDGDRPAVADVLKEAGGYDVIVH